MKRFENYTFSKFQKDIIAGILVGIIALPLGMGFAIASGTSPIAGIYTIVIAGFLISLLGGSKYQIGGPTGAFVPLLLGIVTMYGFENLTIAGLMGGILLILLGVFNVSSFLKHIPRSVVIGFTAGIGVIIFFGQISNFLGLLNLKKHSAFLSNVKEILVNIPNTNLYSLLTASICLGVILITLKRFPKFPSALLGIAISSIAALYFFPNSVATIGDIYGNIPNQLPTFHFPNITLDKLWMLFPSACLIAMLGGLESLLSARVADELTGEKHCSKKELIGQGIANTIVPFFDGIPATGAIARTATNIKNGAASPLSGIIHSVTVLLVLLLFAPYTSQIPLASLAPVLMVVAWNMSQRQDFVQIMRGKKEDCLILLSTFFGTVLADLTIGVAIGLFISFFFYLKKRKWKLTTLRKRSLGS